MDIEHLRSLLAKATPGPWEVDTVEHDGAYGSGPDADHGFKSPVMLNGDGKLIFDAYSSDLIEVHEEYDDDGCTAWDETGRRNFDLAAAAVNSLPELLDRIEALSRELEEARDLLRDAGNQFAIYADLHAAKGTPEADEKAKRNREWADRLLAHERTQP